MGYILRVVRRAYSQSDSPGGSTRAKSCAYDCFVFLTDLPFNASLRVGLGPWNKTVLDNWSIGVNFLQTSDAILVARQTCAGFTNVAAVLDTNVGEAPALFMAALRSRCEHYIFILWFLLSFFYFISSPNLSGRRLDVYHTSTHGVVLVQI